LYGAWTGYRHERVFGKNELNVTPQDQLPTSSVEL
jgi:hypothetical protein